MEKNKKNELPLIYSCSGCSNVGQLANAIALKVNMDGIAEMSCITGVGGKVKSLAKKAQSNRPIIVIDGCVLQCSKECLKGVNIKPTEHVILTDYDFKKQTHSLINLEDEMPVFNDIVAKIKKL